MRPAPTSYRSEIDRPGDLAGIALARQQAGEPTRLHLGRQPVQAAHPLRDELLGAQSLVARAHLAERLVGHVRVDALLAQLVREGSSRQPLPRVPCPDEHLGVGLVVDEAHLGHPVEDALGDVVVTPALAQLCLELGPAARSHAQLAQHDGSGHRLRVGLRWGRRWVLRRRSIVIAGWSGAARVRPGGAAGARLSGARPSGNLPRGALPSGCLPSGALPRGALPSGAWASETPPSGGRPGGNA